MLASLIDPISKAALVTLVAASAPVDAPEPGAWAQWGLAGVVVAYVLWRDHERERRMAAAIDAQQRWIRDTLLHALERNAVALERVAALANGRAPTEGRAP